MDNETLWRMVLSDLEQQVSKAVFQTLLSQTTLVSFDNQIVTIACRKPLLINLIEKRYYDLIKKIVDSYTKSDTRLVFTAKSFPHGEHAAGPLFTLKLPERIEVQRSVRLNPDYTFENFAVSSSNQMAYAAATAVANNPGSSYNPLFLYGGVGVGKTHLMQAVGHFVLNKNKNTRILSCTGEEFTNEIIEAISTKTTTGFKKKYRHLDMLLIDDIQFIAGKYGIQEEFFHTFNAIAQVKGQIILTSDRPPEEINKLEARLQSRFEGGLTIDIGPPDFELKTAILLIKAKQRGVNIPTELAKLITSNVDNIRKLEGVLLRIITESQTRGIPLDENLVRSVLGKVIKEAPKKNSIAPEKAIQAVAAYYNLKLSQIKGTRRDRVLALPRQVLYYILRSELGVPFMEIGELLGGRDHTTVLYGVRKINELLSTNEKIQQDVLGIKTKLFG